MQIRLIRGILLLLAACILSGQQSDTDASKAEARIRLDIRQVLVPVTVSDKKGHSIRGLHGSDFHVAEDNVPQEIVAFSEEASLAETGLPVPRSAADASRVSPAGSQHTSQNNPQHTWVICFDALHTSFANFGRARASLERLLEKGVQPGDRIVLLGLGRQLRVIQPATSDVSKMRAQLASKDFTSLIGGSETAQLDAAVNDVRRRMDLYCGKCPCGRDAQNVKSVCDVELQQIRRDLAARSEQFTSFSQAFLAGLKSVVEELAKLEGHRTLVLVSDGFTLMPGREMYVTASGYVPNSPYFLFNSDQNMQSALNESLKVAALHNIVISTIDARGSFSPSFRAGGVSDASHAGPGSTGRQDMLAARDASNALRGGTLLSEMDSKWSSVQRENGGVLEQLANATGGLYFHNNNDLLRGFRDVLDDRSETYMLSYVPKNVALDGKFHHIAVSVNANRWTPGNLVVRHKLGYWAESAESSKPTIPGNSAINAEVNKLMGRTQAHAVALAVIDHGKVSYVQAYGTRNAKGDPLTTDTVMYGASLTKTVFAYTVMKLVDQGKLSLDVPIKDDLDKPLPSYGPDPVFPDKYGPYKDLATDPRWEKITPRMALTHSTGFSNFWFIEPDQKLHIHFEPGTRFSYSGEGFILLQFAVEHGRKAQGLGLDVGDLTNAIFAKLGMNRTSLVWSINNPEKNVADGWNDQGQPQPHDKRSKVRTAGSMNTTIADFSKFAAALVRGDDLSKASRSEITKPSLHITTAHQFPLFLPDLSASEQRKDLAAGLGVVVFDGPQGHGFFKGGHDGQTANTMVCLEASERCVVVLSNDVRMEAGFADLVRFILGDTGVPYDWEYGSVAGKS